MHSPSREGRKRREREASLSPRPSLGIQDRLPSIHDVCFITSMPDFSANIGDIAPTRYSTGKHRTGSRSTSFSASTGSYGSYSLFDSTSHTLTIAYLTEAAAVSTIQSQSLPGRRQKLKIYQLRDVVGSTATNSRWSSFGSSRLLSTIPGAVSSVSVHSIRY